MKSASTTTLALRPLAAQAARRLALVALAVLPLAACHNYTAAPVCSDANAAVPPGLTGTYTISFQHEDFSAETHEIKVEASSTGRMRTIDAREGRADESRVCQIGGHFVQESWSDDAQAYEQSRLYVTGMGITILPLFYDKAALDAAGIASKVFELPESLRAVLGAWLATRVERPASRAARLLSRDDDEEPTLGLMIDNLAVEPAALMRHALAGPVGLTFLRR